MGVVTNQGSRGDGGRGAARSRSDHARDVALDEARATASLDRPPSLARAPPAKSSPSLQTPRRARGGASAGPARAPSWTRDSESQKGKINRSVWRVPSPSRRGKTQNVTGTGCSLWITLGFLWWVGFFLAGFFFCARQTLITNSSTSPPLWPKKGGIIQTISGLQLAGRRAPPMISTPGTFQNVLGRT